MAECPECQEPFRLLMRPGEAAEKTCTCGAKFKVVAPYPEATNLDKDVCRALGYLEPGHSECAFLRGFNQEDPERPKTCSLWHSPPEEGHDYWMKERELPCWSQSDQLMMKLLRRPEVVHFILYQVNDPHEHHSCGLKLKGGKQVTEIAEVLPEAAAKAYLAACKTVVSRGS